MPFLLYQFLSSKTTFLQIYDMLAKLWLRHKDAFLNINRIDTDNMSIQATTNMTDKVIMMYF